MPRSSSAVLVLAAAAALAPAALAREVSRTLPRSPSTPAFTARLALPPGLTARPDGPGRLEIAGSSRGERISVYVTVPGSSVDRADPSGRTSVRRLAGGAAGHWLSRSVYVIPGSVSTYLVAIPGGAALHLCLQDYPQDATRDAVIRAIALRSTAVLRT
jgi:hypothetical protein